MTSFPFFFSQSAVNNLQVNITNDEQQKQKFIFIFLKDVIDTNDFCSPVNPDQRAKPIIQSNNNSVGLYYTTNIIKLYKNKQIDRQTDISIVLKEFVVFLFLFNTTTNAINYYGKGISHSLEL